MPNTPVHFQTENGQKFFLAGSLRIPYRTSKPALNELYAAYIAHPTQETITDLYTAMRRYTWRLCRSFRPPDLEEAVEDAVVHAWIRLGSHKDEGNFQGWFRGVALNRLINRYRRLRTELTYRGDLPATEPAYEPTAAFIRDPDDLPITGRDRHLLRQLLTHGTYEAAADAMGISSTALRRRLYRLRDKLEALQHEKK